ncbi:MAG: LysM peptidoglycan-binding domain-containing protein [Deltaproteobacteria bacterium]|jgi:murein DD-endopeptidase MepM/ murein hydrolase activator NlpD|nr:LysM peptidoglycan-binding domain-containing protein [Deltaproteobacteria bacterium]
MAPSENGRDKDFVLNSSYRQSESIEPREDVYYGSGSSSGGQPFKHIYIGIAGFLLLIVLTVTVIARTYSLAEKSQLLALQSRLEQLESRLGSMDAEGGLAQAGGSGNQLILLTERLDQLEANMTARISSLATQLNTTAAKPAAEPVKKAEAAPEAEPAKVAPAKIHTVKQGETLYRISRRYDLSVDQLRQYNQLDSKASIYPGQKLKVSSPQ